MLSLIFFMAGSKTDYRMLIVLVKLSWVKGSVSRPKALLLSYCEKAPLIYLNQLGHLRDSPKLEGFLG